MIYSGERVPVRTGTQGEGAGVFYRPVEGLGAGTEGAVSLCPRTRQASSWEQAQVRSAVPPPVRPSVSPRLIPSVSCLQCPLRVRPACEFRSRDARDDLPSPPFRACDVNTTPCCRVTGPGLRASLAVPAPAVLQAPRGLRALRFEGKLHCLEESPRPQGRQVG